MKNKSILAMFLLILSSVFFYFISCSNPLDETRTLTSIDLQDGNRNVKVTVDNAPPQKTNYGGGDYLTPYSNTKNELHRNILDEEEYRTFFEFIESQKQIVEQEAEDIQSFLQFLHQSK